MPKIWGIKLIGELPDWVSAKDIILEMLRRHGVNGGIGKIIEYYGPGLESLSGDIELEKGPNIQPLPLFDPLPDRLEGPVLLKVGDDISTDEFMPAGAAVLPFRSNIPQISKFTFSRIDETFYDRALPHQKTGSIEK